MNENSIKIKIANDFSQFPGARYIKDGPHSGEEFYESILKSKYKEAKESNTPILLDLDGTWGYASSFISEVFTRLVKEFKDKGEILRLFVFVSNEDPLIIDQIKAVINETPD